MTANTTVDDNYECIAEKFAISQVAEATVAIVMSFLALSMF